MAFVNSSENHELLLASIPCMNLFPLFRGVNVMAC